MKVLRRIGIAFTLFMLTAMAVFINMDSKYTYTRRDIVKYNDQLYKIQEEYLAGVPEAVLEDRYDCFIVLSTRLDDPELAQLLK